jgi:anti-sigma regulatory factor (Ser/Thr protein kinase)
LNQFTVIDQLRVPIYEEGDVTKAIVSTANLASEAGMDGVEVNKMATVVSELARNIIKYASTGSVRIRVVEFQGKKGIQISASDKGPGIEDIEKALRERFSTGGTLGLGLPGVKRLMDDFEIRSSVGSGTAVTALKWLTSPKTSRQVHSRSRSQHINQTRRQQDESKQFSTEVRPDYIGVEGAFLVRPFPGEWKSGDTVYVSESEETLCLVLIDALGHGMQAYKLASRARAAIDGFSSTGPISMIRIANEKMGSESGAAMGVVCINLTTSQIRFAGVGNVTMRLIGAKSFWMPSSPGNLGSLSHSKLRSIRVTKGKLEAGDLLVMYSDGVKERFEASIENDAFQGRPSAVASYIINRFGKSHDDASCVVARIIE